MLFLWIYIALQKAYKKIFAGAGISKELTASIWEAASKHDVTKSQMQMVDVLGKKAGGVGVKRRVVKEAVGATSGSVAPGVSAAVEVEAAAGGGGGVIAASSTSEAPEAAATNPEAPPPPPAIPPPSVSLATGGAAVLDSEEERARLHDYFWNKGIQSVIVVPEKKKDKGKSSTSKPKKLMDQWVRPPLPKLPRLVPSASNPPIIKKSIADLGKKIEFRPSSAWNLAPATASRPFDRRNDIVTGVVSLGYDIASGLEHCRVHVGNEDDERGNDYLIADEGEESQGRKEKRKSWEQIKFHKEKTFQLSRKMDQAENQGKISSRKFIRM